MDTTSEMKKAISERKKVTTEKVKRVKVALQAIQDNRHTQTAERHLVE